MKLYVVQGSHEYGVFNLFGVYTSLEAVREDFGEIPSWQDAHNMDDRWYVEIDANTKYAKAKPE